LRHVKSLIVKGSDIPHVRTVPAQIERASPADGGHVNGVLDDHSVESVTLIPPPPKFVAAHDRASSNGEKILRLDESVLFSRGESGSSPVIGDVIDDAAIPRQPYTGRRVVDPQSVTVPRDLPFQGACNNPQSPEALWDSSTWRYDGDPWSG